MLISRFWALAGSSLIFLNCPHLQAETLPSSAVSNQEFNSQEEVLTLSQALNKAPLDPNIESPSEILIDASFADQIVLFREPIYLLPGYQFPALKGLLANPLGASKTRRSFKPGPCFFPFMENCIKGPYLSAGFFALSSVSKVDSTYSKTSSYVSNGSNFKVSTFYDISSNSNQAGTGGEFSLGYDHGGIRNELGYSYASSQQLIGVDDGFDYVTVNGETTALPYGIASTSGIPGSVPAPPVSATISRQSLLAKTSLDIPTSSRVIPYLGFGIGIALVDVSPTTSSKGVDVCAALDSVGRDTVSFSPCPAVYAPSGGVATLLLGQLHAGFSYVINPRLTAYAQASLDYTGSGNAGDIQLPSAASYSSSTGIRFRL